MGLKQSELVTPFSNGPTALTPSGKPDNQKFFQLSRADTTTTLKAVLPAQSSVFNVTFYGGVNSNAGTSSTATITISNNSGVISTGTVNLLTTGITTGVVQMSALPNIEPMPLNGDLKINVIVAETGTASTLGGPWVVSVAYV